MVLRDEGTEGIVRDGQSERGRNYTGARVTVTLAPVVTATPANLHVSY